jgi:hypothetical protein
MADVAMRGLRTMQDAIFWEQLKFQPLPREADAVVLNSGFPAEPFAY